MGISELCFLSLKFTRDRSSFCPWRISNPRAEIRCILKKVQMEHLLGGVLSSKQRCKEEASVLL